MNANEERAKMERKRAQIIAGMEEICVALTEAMGDDGMLFGGLEDEDLHRLMMAVVMTLEDRADRLMRVDLAEEAKNREAN